MRPIAALKDEIALIPLIGHTRGHCGVAVNAASDHGSNWLLHAGDAYFHYSQMTADTTPNGIKAFEKLMEVDRDSRVANLARLKQLSQSSDEVSVFCAHDLVEFDQLAQR